MFTDLRGLRHIMQTLTLTIKTGKTPGSAGRDLAGRGLAEWSREEWDPGKDITDADDGHSSGPG